jgi:hypothetical protein
MLVQPISVQLCQWSQGDREKPTLQDEKIIHAPLLITPPDGSTVVETTRFSQENRVFAQAIALDLDPKPKTAV